MRIRWPNRKRRIEELDEEIETHLTMAAEDLMNRGALASAATQAARRELGNFTLLRELTQDVWGGRWWRDLLDDLRFGARILAKSPGFMAVAVLTLALGIGVNTSLFSVVNGVLLNPLPYPHPEELVTLHESKPNFATGSISYANFLDWEKDNQTFSSMAVQRGTSFILTGLGEAEQVDALFVTSGYFEQLGVTPVIGRTFEAEEDRIGAAPTAMITESFWKKKFAGEQDVLGKSLTLDGRGYVVVGVIPGNFDLLGTLRNRQIYVPLAQWNNPILMNRKAGLGIHGIGRLKPGITIKQARADMQRVTQTLAATYPDADQGIGAAMIPLREWMLGNVRPYLLLLFGAVGFVLLIACVNVANLLLARSTGRAHEFAMRAALGAGRGRILRQLLTESILLAAIGGSLGVLVAVFGTRAVLRALPTDLPRAAEVGVDARVLIFAAVISLFAGVCFGLTPALKTAKAKWQATMKEGGRGRIGGRHGVQHALVTAEMALALVLLIGAGLMIRTLGALWNVNPGFDANKVVTFAFSLPPSMAKANADSVRASLREVHDRFQSAPGLQALSFTWGAIPMFTDDEWLFWIDGQTKPANDNEMKWALSYVVEPDYLKVMGIPLHSGRFFTEQDDERASPVAVIDEVLAHKFFGDANPIGKRLHIQGTGLVAEIIGVVGHVKQWGLDSDDSESLRAQLYTPLMQLPDKAMALSATGLNVMARAQSSSPIFESIRRISAQMSSEQVVFGAQSMKEVIAKSLSARKFLMIALGIFAVLALVLASIGIYGVVSYVVGQRTQEIGVRLAMGAQPSEVLRLVLVQGARMAALGMVIGLVAALALTRLMGSMLFAIGTSDPLTYSCVTALLFAVSLAACWMPARRAARMNPVDALRYE
ncbi:MAG TPA: ABC transporter permease [Candidatus Acidoferrum sp.]|jgi:predicted permease